MKASVYEQSVSAGEWAVEYIPGDDDGTCDKAVFFGPRAREQAHRWAKAEYGEYDTLAISPVCQRE